MLGTGRPWNGGRDRPQPWSGLEPVDPGRSVPHAAGHIQATGSPTMTMILSAFGLLGRFAGDLLTSALSWASSLLFGRVPRSHQIFLVLMMAGSFLWFLAGLGLLVPGLASWVFAATPHPPFLD